jgi:hypothetical protein
MYLAVRVTRENFLCSKQNVPQPISEDVFLSGQVSDDFGIVSLAFECKYY